MLMNLLEAHAATAKSGQKLPVIKGCFRPDVDTAEMKSRSLKSNLNRRTSLTSQQSYLGADDNLAPRQFGCDAHY
ncbi:hypothetical protein [Pseudomonas thivervalensis]|uniref:hypothetical protein n=1 Tax=Pseudomonas thivervalensis TaxID=86265 RepID=UPI003CF72F6B